MKKISRACLRDLALDHNDTNLRNHAIQLIIEANQSKYYSIKRCAMLNNASYNTNQYPAYNQIPT